MEQDPVEQTYISQGTPEVTTDTDSDKEMENCGPEKSNIDSWASLERIALIGVEHAKSAVTG